MRSITSNTSKRMPLDPFEHLVEFLMVYYDMTFEEARQWYDKNKQLEDMEELIKLMEQTQVDTTKQKSKQNRCAASCRR